MFKTRAKKEEAKKAMDIRGYFGKVARGRPPKSVKGDAPVPPSVSTVAEGASTLAGTKGKSETVSKPVSRKSYDSKEGFALLRDAVLAHIHGDFHDMWSRVRL
jgi:hypothetical protein